MFNVASEFVLVITRECYFNKTIKSSEVSSIQCVHNTPPRLNSGKVKGGAHYGLAVNKAQRMFLFSSRIFLERFFIDVFDKILKNRSQVSGKIIL